MTVKKHLQVFLASSKDVQTERDAMPAVVERANRYLSDQGLHLDLYRYEDQAIPGLHPDGPQALINPDLDKADIVVLLMWNRVGKGTAEELARSLARWEKTGRPELLPYLCTQPSSLDTFEALENRREVLKTKDLLEPKGLLGRYANRDDFAQQAEMHLLKVAQRLGR